MILNLTSIYAQTYTVQPRLSGLLGTIQTSPDNQGSAKYYLLLSPYYLFLVVLDYPNFRLSEH